MQPAQKLSKDAAFRRVMYQSDRGRNECIQNFLDGRPTLSRLPFIFIQKIQPFLIEWPETAQNHSLKQCFFRFEVIVNGGKIDVRCSNDRS